MYTSDTHLMIKASSSTTVYKRSFIARPMGSRSNDDWDFVDPGSVLIRPDFSVPKNRSMNGLACGFPAIG
ncbi:hypothetical protein D3C85_1419550 [compost metagenome]